MKTKPKPKSVDICVIEVRLGRIGLSKAQRRVLNKELLVILREAFRDTRFNLDFTEISVCSDGAKSKEVITEGCAL